MSDTSTIELSPAPTATDEPYVSLTVLSDMRLLMSPTQIAREGEHNSALFKIVAQPSSLDPYACRAEVRTSDGSTTYRLVADGEFRLTLDMAVTGIGHLQLVYSDGVDVTRKTALAQFTVTRSINAIDQSDPDFQDGLAQLQSRAFANVTYASDTGLLAFYNVGMNPLGSVIIAGGGGIPDVPAANGAYARTRNVSGTDWTDFNALGVAPLNSPVFTGTPTAPTPDTGDASARLATTQFVDRDALMRRGGQMTGSLITIAGIGPTNPGLAIGDNSTGFYRPGAGLLNATVGGVNVSQFMTSVCAFFVPINAGNNVVQAVADATTDTDALNRRTGDGRYVPAVGGTMVGDLYMIAASGPDSEIGIQLGGRAARIYWGTGIIMRRGGAGESVYIENNNGGARSEVLTYLVGDGRYLQQTGGFITGAVQLLFTPAVPNDAVTKGYVDTRRAPPLLFDIPVNYPIPGDGAWHTLYTATFAIPRGGNSLVMVSLSCNIGDLGATTSIALVGARISGNPQRNIWAYGFGPPGNVATGFTVDLFAEVSGTAPNITIELISLNTGSAPPSFTVLGGNASVAARSQLCIIDLGPR